MVSIFSLSSFFVLYFPFMIFSKLFFNKITGTSIFCTQKYLSHLFVDWTVFSHKRRIGWSFILTFFFLNNRQLLWKIFLFSWEKKLLIVFNLFKYQNPTQNRVEKRERNKTFFIKCFISFRVFIALDFKPISFTDSLQFFCTSIFPLFFCWHFVSAFDMFYIPRSLISFDINYYYYWRYTKNYIILV